MPKTTFVTNTEWKEERGRTNISTWVVEGKKETALNDCLFKFNGNVLVPWLGDHQQINHLLIPTIKIIEV